MNGTQRPNTCREAERRRDKLHRSAVSRSRWGLCMSYSFAYYIYIVVIAMVCMQPPSYCGGSCNPAAVNALYQCLRYHGETEDHHGPTAGNQITFFSLLVSLPAALALPAFLLFLSGCLTVCLSSRPSARSPPLSLSLSFKQLVV